MVRGVEKMEIGFMNGEFVDISSPVIPIQERGHQFGDGVYEVVRVYRGVPFLLTEHLNRLENSAYEIRLNVPYTRAELIQIITEGIHRSGLEDAEVYVQITRGIAGRNHLFPDVPPSFTMTVRPIRHVPQAYYDKGTTVYTAEDTRWKYCFIKSLNLLPNIMAKQTATERGGYEAILIKDDVVMEGSSTNVFVVKDKVIYTTPTIEGILAGITRRKVIEIANQLGYQVVEDFYSVDFLKAADEVFLTSTVIEVLPVLTIDDETIQGSLPGSVTMALSGAYKEAVRDAIQASSPSPEK